MGKNLIVISGFSASGKTTFSKYISKKRKIDIIAFRNIARELATENGYKYIRDFYSYEEDAVDKTNKYIYRKIVDFYKDQEDLIFEGVISKDTIFKLRKDGICNIFICIIDVSYSIRMQRIVQREEIGEDRAAHELKRKDNIKEAIGINWLRNNSDIILNGERDIYEMEKIFNKKFNALTL